MVTQAVPYIWPEAKDMFMTVNVRELLFGGITLHCSAEEISNILSLIFMIFEYAIFFLIRYDVPRYENGFTGNYYSCRER